MINGGSGNENLVGGFGNDAHLNKSKITNPYSGSIAPPRHEKIR
ncbi:MAG: hypothetical protein V7K67_01975 [Nostoc sp.]